MEKLFEMAKKVAEKAEIYHLEEMHSASSFANDKLQDMSFTKQSGYSLRIIKDGKLGFAYTKNLINREELIQNALDSLKGCVEANYEFPLTKDIAKLDIYDEGIEKVSGKQMVDECLRMKDYLKSEIDNEIFTECGIETEKVSIMNTTGTNLTSKKSWCVTVAGATYPGTAEGLYRIFSDKSFKKAPDEILKELVYFTKASKKEVSPKAGKMKVLFMPGSLYTLTWRIFSGTSSKSVYTGISPLKNKLGKKIFSDKITIIDNPHNSKIHTACVFDDEGVATKPFTLVENGILKSFYYDLNYAKKLGKESTGHGYKDSDGNERIALLASPTLSHARIMPGKKSLEEIIKSIDRGIILEGVLGAHSGNIPNGDYSVGVSPALYVENGEIIGRVKDAMVAGNVYETLNNVVDVSKELTSDAISAVLCDDVSVSTKN